MPDNTVPQSINNGPITSISPGGVSSIKGPDGREWISDQVRDDKAEVAPPLFETETTPSIVETLPSVEISPSAERKQQVIEEAQKPDAQIPDKPGEKSPTIVNKTTGKGVIHHLETPDMLTTIADDDEAEFIEKVEQHTHVH